MATRILRASIVLSWPLTFAVLAAQVKMTDYRRLVTESDVQVSPNNQSVAFVKSVPNFKEDTRLTTIEVVNTTSGAIKVLTSGAHTVSSPRWSPKGNRIAFLQEDSNKVKQLCVVSSSGSGTVRVLTRGPRDVQQLAWSPAGDRIAFVTPDDAPNAAAVKAHNDLFDLHDDGFLTSSIPVPSHIWLISSNGGAPRRLTHGSWSVLEAPPPFQGAPSDPSWSPDGRSITFIRQADADDSDSDLTTVAVADVATGTVTAPTKETTYEYQAAYSPKSKAIAYLYPHGPTPLSEMDVCVSFPPDVSVSNNRVDRDILDFKWLPDGNRAIVIATDGIKRYIWELGLTPDHLADGPNRIDLGEVYPSEVNVGKAGGIAVVASSASRPPEIYYLAGPNSSSRQLTNFNAPLRALKYAKVDEISWTSPDGEKCDGVLTYPVGYSSTRKYPLVVFIHGGPEAAATAQYIGFEGDLLRQSLAGDGYIVFEPNYRGSDNLGNAHEHAIYQNPCLGPASDILAGLQAVDAQTSVDEGRIAVAGHSYGGYMTSWLISHDHRWRCAVVADGAVDWTQEYNLAADGNLAWTRDSLGGTPSDPQTADLYRTASPVTYAGDITTPTLILSGTADETVPITESFTLFHVLKDHKVPVRFIAVPGAHHSPDDPVKYEAFYGAMESWIRHYNP